MAKGSRRPRHSGDAPAKNDGERSGPTTPGKSTEHLPQLAVPLLLLLPSGLALRCRVVGHRQPVGIVSLLSEAARK